MDNPMAHVAPIQTKIIGLPFRVYNAAGMMIGQYPSRRLAEGNTNHIPDAEIRYEP